MKKIISKLTAVILLICMIAGNIPAAVVYGTEIGQAGDRRQYLMKPGEMLSLKGK